MNQPSQSAVLSQAEVEGCARIECCARGDRIASSARGRRACALRKHGARHHLRGPHRQRGELARHGLPPQSEARA